MSTHLSPSYPTRSLRFLGHVHDSADGASINADPTASLKLNIIIAGAGLGGLATAIALARRGHSVTVFEQVHNLGEVGAGIQIPPNSNRLLLKWGVGPFLENKTVETEGIFFRRWENGKVIGHTRLVPDFRDNFDAPYFVVHRAHFHNALYKRAAELGVNVKVGSKVANYDLEAPSLTLEDGSTHTADLIVAVDGVKSLARSLILGDLDQSPQRTGNAAYRATVDVEKMRADQGVSWLLEKPAQNCWIGDNRHVMTYTISGGKSFNMVFSHPEPTDPATWRQETALSDMKKQFSGWDPCLTKIINMIDTTLKWPLLSGRPLERWVAPSSKVLILGDAAHAMVPYMSQGAAMAVEDGAALAEVLSHVSSKQDIPAALHVFETVRIKRTGQMQQASLINGEIWHYADGPEQRARDEAMQAEVEGRPFLESPNQWSDPVTQDWCYGYDAEKAVREAWERCVADKKKRESGDVYSGADWL